MEIFRLLGVHENVYEAMAPVEHWRRFRYSRTWTMANLGAIIDYKETGKKRAVNFFGPMGAAPAIMEQFTGVQAAIFMMLSPLQHIELANYMVDPRLEMKTFQSLWPDGTKESFALN